MFDEIDRVPPAIKSTNFFDQSVRDYCDVLGDVDIPTLVCTGEDDTLLDPAGVGSVAEQTANATLERFTDRGHCSILEEPDNTNRVITEFVHNCTE